MLLVRNYGLDVLRILLCLTVVVFHYGGEWSCGGGVAVDGFFVLSGFLAVCSARGSAQGNIVEYYRKKCWRLLPVLLIAWAVGLAVPYLHYVFSGAVSMALSVLWEKDFFVDFDGKHTFCCVPERYVSSC